MNTDLKVSGSSEEGWYFITGVMREEGDTSVSKTYYDHIACIEYVDIVNNRVGMKVLFDRTLTMPVNKSFVTDMAHAQACLYPYTGRRQDMHGRVISLMDTGCADQGDHMSVVCYPGRKGFGSEAVFSVSQREKIDEELNTTAATLGSDEMLALETFLRSMRFKSHELNGHTVDEDRNKSIITHSDDHVLHITGLGMPYYLHIPKGSCITYHRALPPIPDEGMPISLVYVILTRPHEDKQCRGIMTSGQLIKHLRSNA